MFWIFFQNESTGKVFVRNLENYVDCCNVVNTALQFTSCSMAISVI